MGAIRSTTFEAELKRLGPILPLIADALSYGISQMRQHFDRIDSAVDRDLAPHLVRYHTKKFLIENDYDIEGLQVLDIRNNGLSIRYHGGALRIWKGDDYSLPLPGPSRPKLAFLSQQLGFSFAEPDALPPTLNVMLLWSVDSEYEMDTLYLSLPAEASRSPQYTHAYWTEPIPPTALIAPGGNQETEAPRQDDRLDLEPLDKESTQAEAR